MATATATATTRRREASAGLIEKSARHRGRALGRRTKRKEKGMGSLSVVTRRHDREAGRASFAQTEAIAEQVAAGGWWVQISSPRRSTYNGRRARRRAAAGACRWGPRQRGTASEQSRGGGGWVGKDSGCGLDRRVSLWSIHSLMDLGRRPGTGSVHRLPDGIAARCVLQASPVPSVGR